MMKRRIATMGLALCMVLSLLPVSVWAEGDGSAPAGTSLQEQIDGGSNSIKLDANVDLADKSLTIPAGRVITLDLNGHQLSSNISPVVAVKGSLTVKDNTVTTFPTVKDDNTVEYQSGSIATVSDIRRDAVQVQNGGSFVLESGMVSASNAAIYVDGAGQASSITIKGGYVKSTESAILVRGQGAKAVIEGGVILSEDNAVVSGNGQSQNGGTEITMSSGALISKIKTAGYITCGIYHPQKGTLNITGGEIRAPGGVGILMRGGSLVLDKDPDKELKITADGSGTGKVGDAGLNVEAGSAVVLDQKSGYYDNESLMFEAKKQSSDPTDLSQYKVKEYVSDGFELKKETTADGIKYSIKKEETTPPVPTTYTITFDANGGTLSGASTMTTGTDGKLASLPSDPTRTDYTFLGWYTGKTGGTKATKDTVFTKDTTVYAIWEAAGGTTPVTYTVTFYLDKDDTTQAHATKTTKADHTIDWPSAPTKTGYTFKGWFDADNKAYTAGAEFFADTSLYAQWEGNSDNPAKTFTITLNANGGALSGGSTVTTGEDGKLSAMPADPKREGYTFNGWFTAASGGVKVDLKLTFTQDSTIYAQWTKDTTPPSDGRYRVYGPGYVSGGRVDISHSTAEPGTRVTIELWPWSDYDLDWLTVTNLDTGRRLSLTERYSDEYTFIMPSSDVEVEVSYSYRYHNKYYTGTYYTQEETPVNTGPVKWYYSGGSIYHADSGLVPTSSPLTRDMLISVLYNMDPSSSGDPTIWAGSKGIIPDIYISVLWGVDKPISREQTAMILYCYSQHMGYDTSKSTSLAGYTDYRQISAVARPAMSWAKAAGLISGTSASTLSPQAILTSGQGGAILTRYVANVSRTW